jgi:hypothetical protein
MHARISVIQLGQLTIEKPPVAPIAGACVKKFPRPLRGVIERLKLRLIIGAARGDSEQSAERG